MCIITTLGTICHIVYLVIVCVCFSALPVSGDITDCPLNTGLQMPNRSESTDCEDDQQILPSTSGQIPPNFGQVASTSGQVLSNSTQTPTYGLVPSSSGLEQFDFGICCEACDTDANSSKMKCFDASSSPTKDKFYVAMPTANLCWSKMRPFCCLGSEVSLVSLLNDANPDRLNGLDASGFPVSPCSEKLSHCESVVAEHSSHSNTPFHTLIQQHRRHVTPRNCDIDTATGSHYNSRRRSKHKAKNSFWKLRFHKFATHIKFLETTNRPENSKCRFTQGTVGLVTPFNPSPVHEEHLPCSDVSCQCHRSCTHTQTGEICGRFASSLSMHENECRLVSSDVERGSILDSSDQDDGREASRSLSLYQGRRSSTSPNSLHNTRNECSLVELENQLFTSNLARPIVHSRVDYTHHLVPDIREITNCTFYWGVIDRYESDSLLSGRCEGTFLLRDRAQDDFLYTVSFCHYNRCLHARIVQWGDHFSFDIHNPSVFSASSVHALIKHYNDSSRCLFFEPLLTNPLHRTFPFSLRHIARSVICSYLTTYDDISKLPLPMVLKAYLRYYHYKLRVGACSFHESVVP